MNHENIHIPLSLTVGEVDTVLKAIAQLPYAQVASLYQNIQTQAIAILQRAQEAAAEAPEQPAEEAADETTTYPSGEEA